MQTAIRWLNVVFGRGDDDHPFWLLTVRCNILLLLLFTLALGLWHGRRLILAEQRPAKTLLAIAALTVLAAALRFGLASANLLDFAGVPYSRLLIGYKGVFGTAQFYSPFYEWSGRNLEHGILFNRIAGTLTVPLLYLLCRQLKSGIAWFPLLAALLMAVSPLHILTSASDALSVLSSFLLVLSYVLILRSAQAHSFPGSHLFAGLLGLTLLTQVRYENVLFLLPALLWLLGQWRTGRKTTLSIAAIALVPLLMLATYGSQAAAAGSSYRSLIQLDLGSRLVRDHLLLNPFMSVPALVLPILGLAASRYVRTALVAQLCWALAIFLCMATARDGQSVARTFANWLPAILTFAAFGIAAMMGGPSKMLRAAGLVLVAYLSVQPLVYAKQLSSRHLEMIEHERFQALLKSSSREQTIIVPDDELLWRQSQSTLEAYQKYAMIRAANADGDDPELLGITSFLEQPAAAGCDRRQCIFFAGIPCLEQPLFELAATQCRELVRHFPTIILEKHSTTAGSFADCAIYGGALAAKFCPPKSRDLIAYELTVRP